jgi:hypothetical protein
MYTIDEFLQNMRSREEYFQYHIKNNNLFEPEYRASNKINNILESGSIDIRKATEILSIYNDLLKEEHYDGSGWFDFTLMLRALLRLHDIETVGCYDNNNTFAGFKINDELVLENKKEEPKQKKQHNTSIDKFKKQILKISKYFGK